MPLPGFEPKLTVADLRAALDGVPDDVPVIILYDSYFGSVACDLIEYDTENSEWLQRKHGIDRAFVVGGE